MKSLVLKTTAAAILIVVAAQAPGAEKTMSAQNYAWADAVRAMNPMTLGGRVFPHWLNDGARFYYTSEATHDHPGTTFLVDPRNGTRRPLFDAASVAESLGRLTDREISAQHLPNWSLTSDEKALWFDLSSGRYLCDLSTSRCHAAATAQSEAILAKATPKWAVRSPDGRWDAFIWNHNVYIRPAKLDRATHDDLPPGGLSASGRQFTVWRAARADRRKFLSQRSTSRLRSSGTRGTDSREGAGAAFRGAAGWIHCADAGRQRALELRTQIQDGNGSRQSGFRPL